MLKKTNPPFAFHNPGKTIRKDRPVASGKEEKIQKKKVLHVGGRGGAA